jgi:hypothetical protein
MPALYYLDRDIGYEIGRRCMTMVWFVKLTGEQVSKYRMSTWV